MTYDPERHHRRSTRLRGYDYGEAGAYFVTVCVEHRECLLGQIADGRMTANEWGQIAGEGWKRIADHWPTVALDAFVIMPNHMHGIVVIMEEAGGETKGKGKGDGAGEEGGGGKQGGGRERGGKEGGGTPPLHNLAKPTLGAVVAYWKYQTSKRLNTARQTAGARLWQRNYHDRIIRSEEMMDKASAYIACNPAR